MREPTEPVAPHGAGDPGDPDAPVEAPQRSGIGRKAGLVLGSQAIGSVLGFLSLLVIGRYFGTSALGLLAFAQSSLGILQLLGDLGFGAAHIHFVAKGTAPARALGVYARVRLLLMVFLAGAVAIGSYVWFVLLGKSITDATTVPIMAAVLATQGLILLRTILTDTWVGQERFNRSETVKTTETVLVLLGLAAVGMALAASRGRWTPLGPVATWLAGALHVGPWGVAETGLALALVYLGAKLLSLLPVAAWGLKDRVRVGPWEPALARRYAGYALPVALGTAAALLVAYTDVVMLGYFKTSAEVGEFVAAQRLAGVSGILATALAAPLLPRFSALLREGRHDEARATMRRSERFLLLVAVPATAILVTIPGPLLHIAVSDDFAGAAMPMRLLALSALIGTAMVPSATKVMGSGRARAGMVGTLLTVGTNALLNLWLLPDSGLGLGATGAAISSLVASLVGATYLRLLLRKDFQTPLFDGLFARMLLAGLAGGAVCALGYAWWPQSFARFWMVALWSLASGLAFLAAALALRATRPADLRTLARVANPRTLLRELRGKSD